MPNPDNCGLDIFNAAAEAAGKESVTKLSKVIGDIFPFWGLKRKAVDVYISEIERSDLSPESKMIAIANTKKTFKHLNNQLSVAKIALESAKPETDFSEASLVDNEWLERFMDSARFVSDEEVQVLWGNILAKEFEAPNSAPPSIIRILSEITPRYARIFAAICNLAVNIDLVDNSGEVFENLKHIILPNEYEYLERYDICFVTLNELQSLGLIQWESIGMAWTFDSHEVNKTKTLSIKYGEQFAIAIIPDNNSLPIGEIRLTDAGQVIANLIANEQNVPEHFESVIHYLKVAGIKFKDQN